VRCRRQCAAGVSAPPASPRRRRLLPTAIDAPLCAASPPARVRTLDSLAPPRGPLSTPAPPSPRPQPWTRPRSSCAPTPLPPPPRSASWRSPGWRGRWGPRRSTASGGGCACTTQFCWRPSRRAAAGRRRAWADRAASAPRRCAPAGCARARAGLPGRPVQPLHLQACRHAVRSSCVNVPAPRASLSPLVPALSLSRQGRRALARHRAARPARCRRTRPVVLSQARACAATQPASSLHAPLRTFSNNPTLLDLPGGGMDGFGLVGRTCRLPPLPFGRLALHAFAASLLVTRFADFRPCCGSARVWVRDGRSPMRDRRRVQGRRPLRRVRACTAVPRRESVARRAREPGCSCRGKRLRPGLHRTPSTLGLRV
jgi:hypothetical protein